MNKSDTIWYFALLHEPKQWFDFEDAFPHMSDLDKTGNDKPSSGSALDNALPRTLRRGKTEDDCRHLRNFALVQGPRQWLSLDNASPHMVDLNSVKKEHARPGDTFHACLTLTRLKTTNPGPLERVPETR